MRRTVIFALGVTTALILGCPSNSNQNDGSGESSGTVGTDSTADGTETGSGTATTGTTDGTGTGETGTAETGTETGDPPPCEIKMCGAKLYECGDCEDNDNDGKADAGDIECLGPCDDDESKFPTGVPGDNVDPCKQDCFWDGDSGQGNDHCDWNLKCDPESPGEPKCPYDPDYNNCPDKVDPQCKEICGEQTPPGCDCFGCCTVEKDGMEYDIYLGDADCSLMEIEKCQGCVKHMDCVDDCEPEKCEQCFGMDLPDDCDEPKCEGSQMPCMSDGEGGDSCPEGFYCLSGCCLEYKPPG